MKDTDKLHVRDSSGGAIVAVKVVPGSSRDRIVGILGRALKITTSAPPERGKANLAAARTLAKALGLSPCDVVLVSGPSSPRKEFRLVGLSPGDLLRHLCAL